MPYTERQLHCLSAMGLVAWRARVLVEDEVSGGAPDRPATAATSTDGVTDAVSVPANGAFAVGDGSPDDEAAVPVPAPDPVPGSAAPLEPLVAPALPTPMPREGEALAAWLPDQPLAPFTWKERRLTRIGRDDAPLLVVVEREGADALPLTGAAAELFERMLGAIGRTRRDTCQCVLAAEPRPGGDTVAALAGEHRPATLVLVRELDAALDADGCRLPGDPFGGPAWCLPHPEVLLARPLDKRLAWDVLKAVRPHLPSPP